MSAGGVIRCVNKTGKSLLSSATAAATKHHGCTPAAASPASVAYSAYSAAESTAARVTSPAGHGGGLGGNQGTAVAFESSSSTSGGYHGSKDEETKPTNTNDVYKSGKADSLGGPGAGGLGAGGSGTRAIVSPLSGVRTVSPLSAVPLSGNSAGRPAGVGVHTTTAPALSPSRVDAVVIGAGQAGLSAAYYLQRAGGLRFVTLDANQVKRNGKHPQNPKSFWLIFQRTENRLPWKKNVPVSLSLLPPPLLVSTNVVPQLQNENKQKLKG